MEKIRGKCEEKNIKLTVKKIRNKEIIITKTNERFSVSKNTLGLKTIKAKKEIQH